MCEALTYTRQYDQDGRIAAYSLGPTQYNLGFDAANRIGFIAENGNAANTNTYAYGAASNRVASVTPASGPVRTFQFDANGSTTADGTIQYTYDTRGRLIQAVRGWGAASYQVNALGQRVQKSEPGALPRVFQYDTRGRLIAETNSDGRMIREYLYLNEVPVAVVVAP